MERITLLTNGIGTLLLCLQILVPLATAPNARSCLTKHRRSLRDAVFAGGNATVDPSTVFLDFLGPLGAATTQAWTAAAESAAVATVSAQITAAVRKGFLTRAAADWQVWLFGIQGLELPCTGFWHCTSIQPVLACLPEKKLLTTTAVQRPAACLQGPA